MLTSALLIMMFIRFAFITCVVFVLVGPLVPAATMGCISSEKVIMSASLLVPLSYYLGFVPALKHGAIFAVLFFATIWRWPFIIHANAPRRIAVALVVGAGVTVVLDISAFIENVSLFIEAETLYGYLWLYLLPTFVCSAIVGRFIVPKLADYPIDRTVSNKPETTAHIK